MQRHVQSLELYLLAWGNYCFKVPNSLYYDGSSLELLALSFVELNPPLPSLGLGFNGYPLLKKLFLFHSFVSDEGIQSIKATCKALECLSVLRCSGLINLKISSLSLKEFEFFNGLEEELIEIDFLPVKANVFMNSWITVVSQLFQVEFLGISTLCLKCRYLLPKIPKVFTSSDGTVDNWSLPYWRKMPFEPLKDGEAMEFRNKIRPIHQLKEIELFYFGGRSDEEDFIKGFLQYAINLERMVLYFNQSGHHLVKHYKQINVPEDVQEELLKALSMIPRASPHVEFLMG